MLSTKLGAELEPEFFGSPKTRSSELFSQIS